MQDDLFRQAIAKTFPNLDQSLQEEIYKKVLGHILEVFKAKVFANNTETLTSFEQKIDSIEDLDKRAEAYKTGILEKFTTLKQSDQERIGQGLDKELTEVMHNIYKAYE